MPWFLERIGLVRSEHEGPAMPVPVTQPLEEAYAPEVPEIDASQVSYEDVIKSVYSQGSIDDGDSIFKIKAYIDILPAEMTKPKKQLSIAGILAVNNINVADLIADGNNRINILNAAETSIKAENDAAIREAEQDIERLKSLIESAEAKIAESKKKTSDACTAIHGEVEIVTQLLDFADGVAGNEGEK